MKPRQYQPRKWPKQEILKVAVELRVKGYCKYMSLEILTLHAITQARPQIMEVDLVYILPTVSSLLVEIRDSNRSCRGVRYMCEICD
jgi:hypothetical protein